MSRYRYRCGEVEEASEHKAEMPDAKAEFMDARSEGLRPTPGERFDSSRFAASSTSSSESGAARAVSFPAAFVSANVPAPDSSSTDQPGQSQILVTRTDVGGIVSAGHLHADTIEKLERGTT